MLKVISKSLSNYHNDWDWLFLLQRFSVVFFNLISQKNVERKMLNDLTIGHRSHQISHPIDGYGDSE